MRQTMNVIVLFTFALTLALSGSASANRDVALGYANAVIKDQVNIWLCPSTLIRYPDMMLGEIDASNGFYQGGVQFGVGDQVFGVFFDKLERDYLYLPDLVNGDTLAMKQKIDLFAARDFGEAVLGFQFSLAGASQSSEANVNGVIQKPETSVSELGLRLGLSYQENFDGFFGFKNVSWTDKDADGKDITQPDGFSIISFGGRYWLDMSESIALVPYFSLGFTGQGYEKKNLSVGQNLKGEKISETDFVLGLGTNIKPNDKLLVVTNIGMDLHPWSLERTYRDSSNTSDGSWSAFPYFGIGMETALNSWLTMRLGFTKSWESESWEPANPTAGNPKTYEGYTDEEFLLGAAIDYKNLTLDMLLNPSLLLNGPYILTGKNSQNMATSVKVTYSW